MVIYKSAASSNQRTATFEVVDKLLHATYHLVIGTLCTKYNGNLFGIADTIHESIVNKGNVVSTFIGRSGPVKNGASQGSKKADNRKIARKEQSQLTGKSMREMTSQKVSCGRVGLGNQGKSWRLPMIRLFHIEVRW